MKKKQANELKKSTLSREIAKPISIILAIIFIVIIITTITFSGKATITAINGEFIEMANNGAKQIESILLSAKSTTDNVISYLQKAYQISEEKTETENFVSSNGTKETYKSSIYQTEITELSYDVEKYITEVVRQTTGNNADIVGMGVLFEPYAFDKNIKDYSFYVLGAESEKEIEPYNTHDNYSKEEYYAKAATSMVPEFTEPYVEQGITMVTYSVPIIYKQQLKGIVTADINVENFSKVFQASNIYPTKFVTILNENNIIIYDSESSENIGVYLPDFVQEKYMNKITSSMQLGEDFYLTVTRPDKITEYLYFSPITVDDMHWWALTSLQSGDRNKSIRNIIIILIILSIISLALIIAITFYLLKKMLLPVYSIAQAAKQIAKGNLEIDLQRTDSKKETEIDLLFSSFQLTVDFLKKIIEDETYLLQEMAEGNFNVSTNAEQYYIGNFNPILLSLRNINNKLSTTLSQINQSSTQVSTASEQMAKTAQSLAESSTEQANTVEELVVSIHEVTKQVEKNSSNATKVSEKATLSGNLALESNEQMEKMTEAMTKINEKSKQIVSIITTIEDIAAQTNLLSLNASIEAARAGEAGKGFAVVANEISQLAAQSTQAANTTRELIKTSAIEVDNGTMIADTTAKSLQKVTEEIIEITNIAASVKDSSEKQTHSMEQINSNVKQISEVIQNTSAVAEESSATSQELSAQAEELNSLVENFQLKK